jgi:hypothetical protein
MIRKLCLMALGLSLSATLSKAQVPDSIGVPFAVPLTEAEIMANYGYSDSARALIPYWFAQQRKYASRVTGNAVLTTVGVVFATTAVTSPSLSKGDGLLIGVFQFSAGVIVTAVAAPSLLHSIRGRSQFSIQNLRPTLLDHSLLPERHWRRALQNMAVKEFAVARHATNPSRSSIPTSEKEFLAQYGSSDSIRSLIRLVYARRRTYSWLVAGTSTVAVGGFTYANVVSSGLDEQNLAPIGGFAFLVGTPAFFIAKARLKRYSRAVLYRYVEHPNEVPPRLWQAALRQAAKGSR